jgi:hypothetical protein
MSLTINRTKYDYCRIILDWEVGEVMKEHTRSSDGLMYGYLPADILYDGVRVQRLLFNPDYVTYGQTETKIQLQEVHKSLSDGVIDFQRETVRLVDIYKEVVSKAENDLVPELTEEENFTVPDGAVRTLYSGRADELSESSLTETGRGIIARDDTKKLIDGSHAVDFDNISPELAIERLNEKFGLKTWFNSQGEMIVGVPEANETRFIAAPDDERVLKIKDASVSHGREPIRSVTVEGAWVDEPGIGGFSDGIDEMASWVGIADDNSKGGADFKAMGYAERKDIDYGKNIKIKSSKAKRDALTKTAEMTLMNKMKEQNNGSVEIDPNLSGSNPVDLRPGDFLHLVPHDSYFDNPTKDSGNISDDSVNPDEICGGYVNNEVYFVNKVEQNIGSSGDWNTTANIGLFPDIKIASEMYLFNPQKGERVPEEKTAEDGSALNVGASERDFSGT